MPENYGGEPREGATRSQGADSEVVNRAWYGNCFGKRVLEEIILRLGPGNSWAMTVTC